MSQDTIYENEWVGVEDPSLTGDEVAEVQDTVDQLDMLEDKVEDTDDVSSLEAYSYAFKLINHYNDFKCNVNSLENFTDLNNKKNNLLAIITDRKKMLKNNLNVAIEDYIKNAPVEISDAVEKYNKTVDDLKELEKELKAGENRVVVVNNMRLWDMFHVDGEFQRDGNKVIDKEITNLNAIVTGLLKLINDAKNNPSKTESNILVKLWRKVFKNNVYHLMFNRDFTINDSSIKIDAKDVDKPKFETNDTAKIVTTAAVTLATCVIVPLTGVVLAVGAGTIGGLAGQLAGYLFGKSQETTDRDLVSLKALVRKIDGMDTIINSLCKVINEVSSADLPDTFKTNIISSCNTLINHITEITYGITILLTKLESKKK